MFNEAATIGGLGVQLVYYPGVGECRASRWISEASQLSAITSRIDCRAGNTQIAKIISHVRRENRTLKVLAAVFVGDAMEKTPTDLCDAAAGLGVPVFLFQEGEDRGVGQAFKEIAR